MNFARLRLAARRPALESASDAVELATRPGAGAGSRGLALWQLATWAYLAYALLFAGASIGLADLLHHRVLFLDQWRIHHFFFTRPFLESVWVPSAGHRIAVPNLFFHVANVAFSGDNEFLLAVTLTFFIAGAWMLGLAIRRWEGCDAGAERLTIGVVLVTLFWFGNQATLVWAAAGLPCALPVAATLAALSAAAKGGMAQAAGRRRAPWTALAALCAAFGTYSSGQGPAVWPALVLVTLLGRPQWRSAAVFALLGSAAVSLYVFAGTGSPSIARDLPAADGARLIGAAASALVLLGALPAHLLGFAGEVGSRRSVLLAGSCGLAGVLLAGGAIAVALLRRRRLEFSAVVLLGWIAYSVAVAGITGLFRSASFGISNSLTPRYAIWSSLFWAGLLALLPPVFARAESRYGSKRARIATASAAVALAALAWPSHRHWIGVVAERTRLGDETALSLMVGADDPDRQRWHLYRDLDRVHATASELRRRRWNLFRPDWTLLAGTRLADRYRESADPGRVVGAFSLAAIAASTADAGWHVEGWAWDARAGRPPRRIVLVDSSGVVRGLATFTQDATATVQQALPEPGLLARALRRVHPFLPASLGLGPGFFGYVQAGTDVDGLRALAVLDDERTAVPLDAAAPPKAAQRPLPAP